MVDVFDECCGGFIGFGIFVVDCQWVLVYGDFVIGCVGEVVGFVQCGQFFYWQGFVQVVDEVDLFLGVLFVGDLLGWQCVIVILGNVCGVDDGEVV